MKKQNPQKETSKPKKKRKPKSTERPTEGTTHKIEIKNGEKRRKATTKTHILDETERQEIFQKQSKRKKNK